MIEKIRKELGNSEIPIMVLTSDSVKEIGPRAKELGISAVVIKPFEKTSFIEAMKYLISK